MRRLLIHLALIVTLTSGGVIGTSTTASAHTDLVASSPRSGSIVEAPPRQVSLTFSEPVAASFADLLLTTGAGTGLALAVDDSGGDRGGDSATVTAAVPAGSQARIDAVSTWRVDYRVTSADGHPIQGSVRFEVAATSGPSTGPATGPTTGPRDEATAVAPTPQESVAAPAARTTRSTSDPSSNGLLLIVGAGGLIFILVAAIIARGVRGRGSEDQA